MSDRGDLSDRGDGGDLSAEARPPRGSLRLLLDRNFGAFFFAKIVATAGVWIHNIVAAVLAYELSGSAFVVGLVSVAQFGPQLILAPLSGALADRGDRRRQVALGKLCAGVGSGVLAVWLAIVGVEGMPGAWPVVLTALIVGVGFVVAGPAQNALVPAMVRREELRDAMALNMLPPTIARAAGPAIGALIAVTTGPAFAFGLSAAANILFAVVMLTLRIAPHEPAARSEDRSVRAGLRYVRHDWGIAVLLVGVAAVGIAADPVVTLTPPLSEHFGADRALVGAFASSFGIGAGAAFVVLSALHQWLGLPRVGTIGLLLMAGGIGAAGISPGPGYAIAAFAIAGLGMTLALTSLSTQLQQRLPEKLRGRLMALWSVAFLGSRPVAAAINGTVSDLTEPAVALALVAVVVAGAAWLCRPAMLAAYPPPGATRSQPVSRAPRR